MRRTIEDPTTDEAMMRTGSAAAKGMAPSEMNEKPSSQAALPFSRSGSENRCGRRVVDRAMASGATMPAAITAAMIFSCGAVGGGAAVARPAVAKA